MAHPRLGICSAGPPQASGCCLAAPLGRPRSPRGWGLPSRCSGVGQGGSSRAQGGVWRALHF